MRRDARDRGIMLVSYDRPGYGASSARAGQTVADCVEDVRAICSALEIERAGMWGISGGGPRALACAALLSDVVVASASLAALAPVDAAGLDYFSGMGEENVEDLKLIASDPVAARAKMEGERREYLTITGAEIAQALATLLTPTDLAALDGPLADYLALCDREGLASGGDGWWDDGVALSRPWGFDLAKIAVPVLVMHGARTASSRSPTASGSPGACPGRR